MFFIISIVLVIIVYQKNLKIKNIEKGLNDLFQKNYIEFKNFKIIDILIQYVKNNSNYSFYDIEQIILNNRFINPNKDKHDDKEEQTKNKEDINIKTSNLQENNTYIEKIEKDEKIKVKKELDFSKILLVLGTIFILTSSIIFATTNWRLMSNYSKILTLFIIGILQIIISILYYKKFSLKNISLSFYILGSTILSLTILSGSLKGAYLGFALFFISLMIFHFIALKMYKNILLQWSFLLFSNLSLFFITKSIINNDNIAVLALSIYNLILILIIKKFDTKNLEKEASINKKTNTFIKYSKINLMLIIIASIYLTNNKIACLIIAIIISINIFKLKIYDLDNFYTFISFIILLSSTLLKISKNSAISELTYLSTAPLILAILNFLDLFSKKYIKTISYIISFITLIMFALNNFNIFIFKPSIYNIISIIILIVSFNLTINKINNKAMLYINPFFILLLILETNEYLKLLLSGNNFYLVFQNGLILFLVYLIHLLFKRNDKYILRNYISVSIFPLYLLFLGIFYYLNYNYSLVLLIFALISFILNSLSKFNNIKMNYIFSCLFSVTLFILTNVLSEITNISFALFLILTFIIIIFIEILDRDKDLFLIIKTPINIIYPILAGSYIFIFCFSDIYEASYDKIILSFLINLLILVVLCIKIIKDKFKEQDNIYIIGFIASVLLGSFVPVFVFNNTYIYLMPVLICILVYLLISLLPKKVKAILSNKYLNSMAIFILLYNIIYILMYFNFFKNFKFSIYITFLFIIGYLLKYRKLKNYLQYLCTIPIMINIILVGVYLKDLLYTQENIFLIYFIFILILSIILVSLKSVYNILDKFIKTSNVIYLLSYIYILTNITSYEYWLLIFLPIYYIIQLIKEYKLGKINDEINIILIVLFLTSYLLSPFYLYYGIIAKVNISVIFDTLIIILYTVFYFIDKRDNKIKFNKYVFILCNILFSIFISIFIFDIGNIFEKLDFYKIMNIIFMSISILTMILSSIKIKNNLFSIIAIFSMHLFILNQISYIITKYANSNLYILYLLIYTLILLCSRFINKNLFIKNEEGKIIYIDYFAFISLSTFFIMGENLYVFEMFFILSISLLSFCNRKLNKTFEKIIISLSLLFFTLSILLQEYFIIPEIFILEFNIIICFIYILILKYLFKEKFNNKICSIYFIISLIILFLDIVRNGIIYDVIFLFTVCCLSLFYGIKYKRKIFISTSAVFLLLLTINTSFKLWKDFIWVIYLIIIGVIFIIIALIYEKKKKIYNKKDIIKENSEALDIEKNNRYKKGKHKNFETKYKKYKQKRRKIKNFQRRKYKKKIRNNKYRFK